MIGNNSPSPPVPAAVIDLVARFTEHRDAYQSGQYNETQLRREFIDPLFKALGWDIDNEQSYAEAYKDVVHEDAIRVGTDTRAPDYCFRIGGVRKFFVEAKKPSVNLKGDPGPAYQLRRYAWSAKLPLSILTDFEEFAVYDSRIRPAPNDKPSVGRVLYLHYTDYIDPAKWEQIAGVFARQAILKGSFDKYADSSKRKRGTAEVDDAFLHEIESWRDSLAKNIALRNPDITQRQLNVAVQLTIDRIVFLRICEDRGMERYASLKALTSGAKTYERLFVLFRHADARYNSGLFHFEKERERGASPDDLTPTLTLDDKPLKEIITRLYYPESPYEFSVLPADILGQVYEQFLGKVIRLTSGHQAKVEEKPEVRKAGGVYYTPTYIVDYIVQNTVGKLLEGKSPQQIGALTDQYQPSKAKNARPLTILDPACGSGSFLLGAYQFLLDWHLKWYLGNGGPEQHATGKSPRLYQSAAGTGWRLTTSERKRILLSHIHGVDIDTQAVEVTKLSLLLKVLEGENEQTLANQLRLFHERALPDLAHNIKCGNSLIGPDFYDQQQMAMFDEEEKYRINVFDWKAEFKEIMQSGGFDAVIGNPPYIRIQTMKETQSQSVEYLSREYNAAAKGNYDIYVVFVEQGLRLSSPAGCLGFILPHKFFNAEYGAPLRMLLSTGGHLQHIVHFGSSQVFTHATTYTCLLFLTKARGKRCRFVQVDDLVEWAQTGQGESGEILAEEINGVAWNIQVGPGAKVMRRLAQIGTRLKDIAHLFVGLQTDADDVYILEEVARKRGRICCRSQATERDHWFEESHLQPFLKGSLDVRRYALSGAKKWLIFPYHNTADASHLISDADYAKRYPLTWDYLLENRTRLTKRAKGKLGQAWYGYVYKKNHLRFEQPKILAPAIAIGACFAWDQAGSYYFVGSGGGGGGGYGIVPHPGVHYSPLYLLAILNSSLISFWLKRTSSVFRGGYIALNRQYIEDIPIVMPPMAHPADKTMHNKVRQLADVMLKLHPQLAAAKTSHEKTAIQRQIEATDRRIDELVYALYGLTEEEIRIVEESMVA